MYAKSILIIHYNALYEWEAQHYQKANVNHIRRAISEFFLGRTKTKMNKGGYLLKPIQNISN